MDLNFSGDINGLETGISLLTRRLNFQCCKTGIEVHVEKGNGNIEVKADEEIVRIRYQEKSHFFRALGLLLEGLAEKASFCIAEIPRFKTNGVMVDVSRNSVLTVNSVKQLIESMALMGLNMMMLYTEDTYEIKSAPYFGYMRGRYSKEELQECDRYAEYFGIEMIPCIQTLAHLSAALKWDYACDIKDTGDILLVGNDKTYEFIEEMIKSASAPFRSKRIHIGMDEADLLGLGRYLNIHGYRKRFDIMNEHLARVSEITGKYGLKPMMWSDMFFKLASKTGDYYDTEAVITKDVIDNIPKDIQLVYWDYCQIEKDKYKEMLEKHKRLGCKTLFAGGIWTWNRFYANYEKTFMATNAALKACKESRVDEVFATVWHNDGAEANIFSALLGLQLFAEHGYAETLDIDKLKKRFRFCTGQYYESYIDLGKLDSLPGEHTEKKRYPSNVSKILLWQDILIGLFDKHTENRGLSVYYKNMSDKLRRHAQNAGDLSSIFKMSAQLSLVISLKSEIGLNIKKCYDNKDTEMLKQYVQHYLPELSDEVNKLREEHRKQWLNVYKPFGWEVVDIRYGGLLARIDTAKYRLMQYIVGEIDKIDELEEERLFFDGPDRPQYAGFGYCNSYRRIVSACYNG